MVVMQVQAPLHTQGLPIIPARADAALDAQAPPSAHFQVPYRTQVTSTSFPNAQLPYGTCAPPDQVWASSNWQANTSATAQASTPASAQAGTPASTQAGTPASAQVGAPASAQVGAPASGSQGGAYWPASVAASGGQIDTQWQADVPGGGAHWQSSVPATGSARPAPAPQANAAVASHGTEASLQPYSFTDFAAGLDDGDADDYNGGMDFDPPPSHDQEEVFEDLRADNDLTVSQRKR